MSSMATPVYRLEGGEVTELKGARIRAGTSQTHRPGCSGKLYGQIISDGSLLERLLQTWSPKKLTSVDHLLMRSKVRNQCSYFLG